MEYFRLGDILVKNGAITQEQLERALKVQKDRHERLGTILIEEGIINEQLLIETLQMQLGIDFVDLTKVRIPVELASVVPKNIARRHSVVPVRLERDELTLAMADPLNFVAVEEVRTATRKRVIPKIATADAVNKAIATLYGNEGVARAIEEMRSDPGMREAPLPTRPRSEEVADDGGQQYAPAVRLVNSILERAANERASDIHVEPRAEGVVIRMRVDGKLRTVLTVPDDLKRTVVSRLKIMGGMDIAESRVPQDGRANVLVKGRSIDLRISTIPAMYGEKAVIRLLDKSAQLTDARAIGLEGENIKKYQQLLGCAHGMILIVGPTGSGKSSTMYAMIRSLNTDEVNLVTLENPVEYDIDGVTQVQINEKTGMTFAGGLRAILRQDPDIIAVGEIRDSETAEIAIRSAITGHLVLSTVHTGDALSAIDRLVDIGVAPYMISDALDGVISQRLVRRICPHCKEAYIPTPEQLAAIGCKKDEKVRFYRGKGCPQCYHTGYLGRTAAFEILIVDKPLKRAIAAGTHSELLDEYLRKGKFSPLKNDCRRLVLAGVTSLEEALSVLNETIQ